MSIVFLFLIPSVFAVLKYEERCPVYNGSCQYQLESQNISSESCDVLYINGSIGEFQLPKFEKNENRDLGVVKLKPFIDYGTNEPIPVRTLLNVTFESIKWDSLMIQCKQRDPDCKPFRRKFLLAPGKDLPSDAVLYYDCAWINSSSENQEFDFKYKARNSKTGQVEGRYYIFRLPFRGEIAPNGTRGNWKVFSYLDISALPILTVHWVQPPFNVEYYVVEVISSNTSAVLYSKTVEADPSKDVLALDVNAGSFIDSIYVTIKIENYTESISKTPNIILLRRSPNQIALYLTVGIVLFGAAAFFIIFGWRRSEYTGKRPVVLIVYKHTRHAHFNAVASFAQWLESVTNAKVLLDISDVPRLKSKDPSKWYQENFECADYVLVVASPVLPDDRLQPGIYPNVYQHALCLLESYSLKNCNKQFFSVVFPYCKEKDIPFKYLKCFKLMGEAKSLVWHLTHRCDHWFYKLRLNSLFLYCDKIIDVSDHCKPLEESFKEAEDDLKNCEAERSDHTEGLAQGSNIIQQLPTVVSVPNYDEHCKISLPEDQDEDVNSEDINRLLSPDEDDRQSQSNSGSDIHELLGQL